MDRKKKKKTLTTNMFPSVKREQGTKQLKQGSNTKKLGRDSRKRNLKKRKSTKGEKCGGGKEG